MYVGTRLQYQLHEIKQQDDTHTLDIALKDAITKVTVTTHLTTFNQNAVLRAQSETTVTRIS